MYACTCMCMTCLDEWRMHVYGCVRGRGVCERVCVREVRVMGFEYASL